MFPHPWSPYHAQQMMAIFIAERGLVVDRKLLLSATVAVFSYFPSLASSCEAIMYRSILTSGCNEFSLFKIT